VGAGNEGIAAVLEAGPAERGDITWIAHELTADTRRFLLSGLVDAIINQDPGHEARSAARILLAHCLGETDHSRPGADSHRDFSEDNLAVGWMSADRALSTAAFRQGERMYSWLVPNGDLKRFPVELPLAIHKIHCNHRLIMLITSFDFWCGARHGGASRRCARRNAVRAVANSVHRVGLAPLCRCSSRLQNQDVLF